MTGLHETTQPQVPVERPEGSPWSGERSPGRDRYRDLAGFCAMVQANPALWCHDMQLKYLTIDVDVRTASFGLKDRDGCRVPAERVIAAIGLATKGGSAR